MSSLVTLISQTIFPLIPITDQFECCSEWPCKRRRTMGNIFLKNWIPPKKGLYGNCRCVFWNNYHLLTKPARPSNHPMYRTWDRCFYQMLLQDERAARQVMQELHPPVSSQQPESCALRNASKGFLETRVWLGVILPPESSTTQREALVELNKTEPPTWIVLPAYYSHGWDAKLFQGNAIKL